MSDYISRERLINEWNDLGRRYAMPTSPIHKRAIREFPSADVRENKGKWIPVSERLPKNNEIVLCSAISTSISGGYTRFVGCCSNGFWFVQTDAETVSYPRQYEVTAWMPLPEPYKERGE